MTAFNTNTGANILRIPDYTVYSTYHLTIYKILIKSADIRTRHD